MYDLTCVIHVHSTFSDGTATVPEIIEATRSAGAEAVLLTDHDTLEAARQGWEGWHDGVLVLVGHEITTRHGHFLAFGLDEEVDHRGLTEVDICEQVRARGGFGFAAHPFSKGGFVPWIVRPHPWRALEQCAPFGIELWSVLTDTAESWRSPGAALRFLLDPAAVLERPSPERFSQWDRLCAERRVPAIGGLDAHQTGIRIGDRVLSPMRNDRYFKLLRTHLLIERPPAGDLEADRQAAYTALREGRCFLAVDALASARGFELYALSSEGQRAQMGSEVGAGRWMIHAHAPRAGELRLLRDGEMIDHTYGRELDQVVEQPGVYRVEVSLAADRSRVWIVSNPIYVRAAPAGALVR